MSYDLQEAIVKARVDSERPYYENEAETAIAGGTMTVEKARAVYPEHLGADWQPKTAAAKAAVAKAAGQSTATTGAGASTSTASTPATFTAKASTGSAFAAKASAMLVEHGVIIGIGAGTNVDLDGERLTSEGMVTMAHDFCGSDKRVFKANHENEISMKLVESALGTVTVEEGGVQRVLKAGESIPEAAKVVSFDALATKATHWLVGVKPQGEGATALLEAAKAGEIAGFSWAGMVNKKPVAV